MNAWRKQSENACLAYSLWYIGAIDSEALQEYEAYVASHDFMELVSYQRQWVANYAPWVDLNNTPWKKQHPMEAIKSVQLGAAIVRWWDAAHAVAIINGLILDPDGKGLPQTPEEYFEENGWPILTAVSEKP